jgi:hypothetical protein
MEHVLDALLWKKAKYDYPNAIRRTTRAATALRGLEKMLVPRIAPFQCHVSRDQAWMTSRHTSTVQNPADTLHIATAFHSRADSYPSLYTCS